MLEHPPDHLGDGVDHLVAPGRIAGELVGRALVHPCQLCSPNHRVLRDAFADLAQAWLLMAIGVIGLIVLALRYSPDSYLAFRQSLVRQETQLALG